MAETPKSPFSYLRFVRAIVRSHTERLVEGEYQDPQLAQACVLDVGALYQAAAVLDAALDQLMRVILMQRERIADAPCRAGQMPDGYGQLLRQVRAACAVDLTPYLDQVAQAAQRYYGLRRNGRRTEHDETSPWKEEAA
jgi:hypothetical protein